MFYFLRLFSATSNMIRMIVECSKDMSSFAFVLLIAMVGWGNIFYILDYNSYHVMETKFEKDPLNESEPSHFIG
jgi:hypothetical protein